MIKYSYNIFRRIIFQFLKWRINMNAIIQPLGRAMLALIFILSGISKIQDPAGTMGYMQAMGVPGALLWPTVALEVLGGLAIAIGYKTRYAAFALAIFSIATAVIFHRNFADQMQMILFLKNIAMAGGLLLLAVSGKTAYSMDMRRNQNDFFGTRQEKR
jgi:putative oxidoreductase